MSAPKLTKKQKKGLAFRERKGKKPRLDLADEDLAVPRADPPVEEDDKGSEGPHDHPMLSSVPPTKRESSTKKRKRSSHDHGEKGGGDDDDAIVPGETSTAKKNINELTHSGADGATTRKTKRRKLGEETHEEKMKKGAVSVKARFILFVGNLKYTTSLDDIQEHFASCDPPPQIRLLTPKPKSPASTSTTTTKSKGCAFLEFSHRNALQQGLKMHGSTLDGRRINVELTAGGGGKSDNRVQKVQARNKHLLEERKARVQKAAEKGADADVILIAPPQRHSTTSGLEEVPQKRRTWTVPEADEVSGRGGVKKRGKKGKALPRHMGTGANAVAVG